MRHLLFALALSTVGAFAQNDSQRTYTPDYQAVDSIRATIHTKYGPMVFALTPSKTPQTVANFVALAEAKFYDGLKFHRVIPGFMIQGGDPKGDGTGGPGWSVRDEFDPSLHHVPGALSMANAGPGTAGSQFFVVQVGQSHLDGRHTVFGMLREGWDVSCMVEQEDRIDSVRIVTYRKR